MANSFSFSTYSSLVVMLMLLLGRTVSASSDLSDESYYYNQRHYCPSALKTIKAMVKLAIRQDPRMGASLLRLHFHDCFVNGCDASVLLDNTTATNGEKFAPPNFNSLRGFEVIDGIKFALEVMCRQTVSCADILAVAARDSIETLSGGVVSYKVNLGRNDSKTASIAAASTNLPPPFFNLTALISFFKAKGFNAQELVALSGGHTIGKARCATFRNRIWNESNIERNFADNLKKTCPKSGSDGSLAGLDRSDRIFDNAYFRDLVAERGLLHSDQQLYKAGGGGETNKIVEDYGNKPGLFFSDFGKAMVKMGQLPPSELGEIRKNCRRRN